MLFRSGKVDLELAIEEIRAAYLDWLITQGASVEKRNPKGTLSSFKALRHRRDPGLTCLSALEAGGHGTIAKPINDSKGCGGVMRTAPLGLIASWSAETAFEAGAAAAALTHGHSSGFLSGAAMAMLVRLLLSGTDLANAVEATLAVLARYSGAEETVRAIKRGLEAAEVMSTDHEQVIRRLGEGWVGEEALSIALYSALVGKSFSETIAIAANHSGDSDSTASIAGQLYATWRGIADVPHAWVRRLDVFEPILVIANGLLGPDRTTALFCQLSAH